MTTYNTQNPLGSSDPRDLYDNAENLDSLVNGDQAAYSDRLGKPRKSWKGIEDEFAAFIASSGYQFAGDYAAGIEITQYNQVVRDTSGEFWRVSGSTELPYTTTGAGLPEGGNFVSVGDASLRQELSLPVSGGNGAALVNGATIYVESVSESFASAPRLDGQAYQAISWHQGGAAVANPVGGGSFVYRSSEAKSKHNGGTIISPTVPPVSAQSGATLSERVENFLAGAGETDASGTGVFIRDNQEDNSVHDYGAIGNNDTYDDWPSINAAVNRTVREVASTLQYAGRISVPTKVFHLSKTLNLKRVVLIEGQSSNVTAPSVFQFKAGVTNGIVLNATNTIDDTIESTGTGRGAGSIIKGLNIYGVRGTGGTDGHGIRFRQRGKLENCRIAAWNGDGINIEASSTTSNEYTSGNANLFHIENCSTVQNGRHGMYTDLGDANAGRVVGLNAADNEGWGIYDSSFLGNTYIGCHTVNNTLGSYKSDSDNARNVFIGCYTESPQESEVDAPALIIGGLFGPNNGNAFRIIDNDIIDGGSAQMADIASIFANSGTADNLLCHNSGTFNGTNRPGVRFESGPIGSSESLARISAQPGAGSIGSGRHTMGFDIYDGVAGSFDRALECVGPANSIRPGTDNKWSLGQAAFRFTEVFAANATINTSDAREKQQIRELNEAEKRVAIELKSKIRAFKWNAAVEEKGDKARIHFGVIAQEVGDAFRAEGLDPEEYGMFCYDEWEQVPELVEDGVVIEEYQPGGNRYGVRYEELMAFIISAM